MPVVGHRGGDSQLSVSSLVSEKLIRLHAFNLNAQQNILLETHLLAIVHPEISPAELATGISATDLAFEHGVHHALELVDLQLNRLGDPGSTVWAARIGEFPCNINHLRVIF